MTNESNNNQDIIRAMADMENRFATTVANLNQEVANVVRNMSVRMAQMSERPAASARYMRMEDSAKLFDGKDKDYKFTAWLDELFGLAKEYGWGTEMTHNKAIRASKGAVQDKIKHVEFTEETTVAELKEKYLSKIVGDKDDLKPVQEMLRHYKQGVHEPLETYKDRVEKVMKQVLPDYMARPAEAFMVARVFVSGLRDEWLFKAVVPEKFKTIGAAYEFCVSRAKGTDSWKRKEDDQPHPSSRGQGPVEPMDIDAVKREIKCFNCGKMGHMKKDCRLAGKKENQARKEQRRERRNQGWRSAGSSGGSAGGSAGKKKPLSRKKFYRKSIQELTQQLEELNRRFNEEPSEDEDEQDVSDEGEIQDQDFQ